MKRFWKVYDQCLKGIIFCTSAAFVILCLAQIFFRFVLGSSLSWSEEMCKLLFYATIMFGAAVCVTEYRHITIDILTMALPTKVKRWWFMGIYAAMLFFALYMVYYGFDFSMQNMKQFTPAMQISFGYVYLVTPISSILMAINIVRVAIHDFTVTYAPKPAPEKGVETP